VSGSARRVAESALAGDGRKPAVGPLALWRVATDDGARLATGFVNTGPRGLLTADQTLDALLGAPCQSLGDVVRHPAVEPVPDGARILVPIEGQEVWAAGVTFERSRLARNEEAVSGDIYDRVYAAERPELFFKARPGSCRGPGEPIAIRADSTWNVPEPELGVIVNAAGDIVAYTLVNDVSSRSIEGENPLYLSQAKVYAGSCAVGPCLVPVSEAPPLDDMLIELRVVRDGHTVVREHVALNEMRRRPEDLVSWLRRGLDFPVGALLATGTSIVPPEQFTLEVGDRVRIAVEHLGTLDSTVEISVPRDLCGADA